MVLIKSGKQCSYPKLCQKLIEVDFLTSLPILLGKLFRLFSTLFSISEQWNETFCQNWGGHDQFCTLVPYCQKCKYDWNVYVIKWYDLDCIIFL